MNGDLLTHSNGISWRNTLTYPVERRLGVSDTFYMAFNMLTGLWVAYSMSNYREVRALW